MRIADIELSWFRGAATSARLKPKSKSVVVYGANGSGKSTFVDGLELLFNDLKLDHLRHEYSGKQQELGLINTHKPNNATTSVAVSFEKNKSVSIGFDMKGARTLSGDPTIQQMLGDVKKYRTLLRQDEISRFINMAKGQKYSALLPLLGLQELQVVADNLRSLRSAISSESKLDQLDADLRSMAKRLNEDLPDCFIGTKFSEDPAIDVIAKSAKRHVDDPPKQFDFDFANTVIATIKSKLHQVEPVRRRYFLLEKMKKRRVVERLASYRDAIDKLSDLSIDAVDKRIQALDSAYKVAELTEEKDVITCPACGQSVERSKFFEHYKSEKQALGEVSKAVTNARQLKVDLFDEYKGLRNDLDDDLIKTWEEAESAKRLHKNTADGLQALGNRDQLVVENAALNAILESITDSLSLLEALTKSVPPEYKDLAAESRRLEAISQYPIAVATRARIKKIKRLVSFIDAAEKAIREAIAHKAHAVIESISDDVKRFWTYLNPDSKITDIELYMPGDGSKAIDIKLKFFGKEQSSPRNTLSEGQRNSLSLCIFLAIAKQDDGLDLPIVLDDVITSLDGEHRYFFAEMLRKEFTHRQLLIFTHSRDWFGELKLVLSESAQFCVLAPWSDPQIGLAWAGSGNLAEALALVDSDPVAASQLEPPRLYRRLVSLSQAAMADSSSC